MKRILLLCLFGLSILSAKAEEDLWTITTTDTEANYVGAPMANGRIGILPWREPFAVRHVMLNHVFDTDGKHGVSSVMTGINPFILSMKVDGQSIDKHSVGRWRQTIDLREALHRTSFIAAGKAEVSYDLCALRNMPYAGLIRISVKALHDCELQIANRMEIPEEYIEAEQYCRTVIADGIKIHTLRSAAQSRWWKKQVAASSTFLFDPGQEITPTLDDERKEAHFNVKLEKGETRSFALIGSICSSRDFVDPHNEAERQIVFARHEGYHNLLAAHTKAWDELWKGDIEIEGDDEAQRAVRLALFQLYSSCQEGSGLSISPMGLSSKGYNGHIFWDTEIWMFPPMLLLNRGIAKSMIDYRTARSNAAAQKARAYGYKGVMYPWESDDAGEESTPTFALTGPFEHHITADIGIACWNYFCVTRDHEWLRTEGLPLLTAVADFWVSRATANADGSWSIRNVVGANEYKHGATDNAFTNASAKLALQYAAKAATVCGNQPKAVWTEVAEGLKWHRFANEVTKEHADYSGEMIKQADVNLLGYPLGVITDREQLCKDLTYYADKIDPKNGPAMSFAIFCVQYARMGDAKKAYDAFCRSYQPNQRPPFGVIAETPTSNNPYFMTGAGGLLQAVINGFCGLQITDEGVIQLPSVLPEHWRKVTVKGVGADRKTYSRTNTAH